MRHVYRNLLAIAALGLAGRFISAATPLPPPQLCVDNSCSQAAAPVSTSSSGKVKLTGAGLWAADSGYLEGNGCDVNGVRRGPSFIDRTKADPSYVKGHVIITSWGAMEPVTKGSYCFAAMDSYYQRLAASGKRMIIQIEPYGNDSWPNISNSLPQYMKSAPYSGFQICCNGGTQGIVKFWKQPEMDALIDLVKAIYAHYNTASYPYFEGVVVFEDAFATTSPGADETATNKVTQFTRMYAAVRTAIGDRPFFHRPNWLGRNNDSLNMVKAARQYQVCLQNTDSTPSWITDIDYVMRGGVDGHDYRGEVCQAPKTECACVSGNNLTATQFVNHVRASGDAKAHYWTVSRTPDDGVIGTWSYLSTWDQIKTAYNLAGGLNATLPAGFE